MFPFQLKKFKTPRPAGTSEWSHMLVLTFQVCVYMIFGSIVFILLPAIIFRFVEVSWTYLDAVYFAFITLTTIGFGDLVAGKLFCTYTVLFLKYILSYMPTVFSCIEVIEVTKYECDIYTVKVYYGMY